MAYPGQIAQAPLHSQSRVTEFQVKPVRQPPLQLVKVVQVEQLRGQAEQVVRLRGKKPGLQVKQVVCSGLVLLQSRQLERADPQVRHVMPSAPRNCPPGHEQTPPDRTKTAPTQAVQLVTDTHAEQVVGQAAQVVPEAMNPPEQVAQVELALQVAQFGTRVVQETQVLEEACRYKGDRQ